MMNANSVEEESQGLSNVEDGESPRKRICLENSSRKSWSLMDRRTDTEVLQEMGVSLLEPDDSEPHCDTSNSSTKSLKRKYDIENVNPNVNYACSPRSHYSPSKRCRASPSPGTSRHSPRSADKSKPLQEILEASTCGYAEEETPLAQMGAHYYAARASPLSTGGRRLSHSVVCRSEGEAEVGWSAGGDSFGALADEVILGVFKWLPKRTLAHCMLVCKRWHRVACDETLWQRLDLGNKMVAPHALGRILARKPLILRLANSEIGDWHPQTISPSRVQYLDLSMCSIGCSTLENLLEHCPALRKLSLENLRVTERAMALIGKCKYLEALNLTMAIGITSEGLRQLLDGCTSLQALNISWCNLEQDSLNVLVECLPQKLQKLNLSGARKMTDEMVERLVTRCSRLVELDVSDCSLLGRGALAALLPLARLEHLALSRCYLLPPHALTKLSSMSALQYLEVWGMLPATSLNVLRSTLPAIHINQFMFSAIARPTVGARRTSIWGLRTRD